MTNSSSAIESDYQFLHEIYHFSGNPVYPNQDEAKKNGDQTKQLAEDLFDAAEERGRDFPTLEIQDPCQRLESLRVRLAIMRFEAVERSNLIPIEFLRSDSVPHIYNKLDVDMRVAYRDDEPDGSTVGSLTATQHPNYSTIDEVRLDRGQLRKGRTVPYLGSRFAEGIPYDYEAMNFLGIVATYLTALEE